MSLAKNKKMDLFFEPIFEANMSPKHFSEPLKTKMSDMPFMYNFLVLFRDAMYSGDI